MSLTPKQARFVAEYLVGLNATQAAIRAGYEIPKAISPKGYYVYALIDPTNGEIFYIGKGVRRRFAAHVRAARYSRIDNTAKFDRICAILDEGCEPEAVVLAEGMDESAAYTAEREFIKAIGIKRLTNASPGTQGQRERDMARANSLLALMIPFDEWMVLRPRCERAVVIYHLVKSGLEEIAAGQYWPRVAGARGPEKQSG